MSATEAARQAGYSESYANREAAKLVVKPQVAAHLDELRAEAQSDAVMAGREVLERLSSIARGEGQAEKSTKQGIVLMGPDWSDQAKALELLGKHHKLFADRLEVSSDDGLAGLLALAFSDRQ